MSTPSASPRKPRARKAAPILPTVQATARARVIFGERTLFASTHVTGAALKRAVRGLVERTWNVVPYVAPFAANAVKVTFTGSDAFARHTWKWTNATPTQRKAGKPALLLTATAIINLPEVADAATVSRHKAEQ